MFHINNLSNLHLTYFFVAFSVRQRSAFLLRSLCVSTAVFSSLSSWASASSWARNLKI